MRQRQWIDIAIQDIEKSIQYSLGVAIEVDEDPTFITEVDEYVLADYLEKASRYPTAFDTETTGLNPRKDKVIGASLSFEHDKAIAFDLHETDPKWPVLERWLEDPNAKKIMQNAQFDLAMVDAHGIQTKGLIFDTRLAEHLLSSELPGSLEFLRSKYTNIKSYKPTKAEMKTIATWERDRRLRYGCLDALVTFQVYEKQMEVMDQGNLDVLQQIEIPLAYTVNAMEKRGCVVDVDTLFKIEEDLLPKANDIKETYFDPIDINPSSPKQLKEYFDIESTGVQLLQYHIKHNHPKSDLMVKLLEYRSITKLCSTYVKGVMDRLEYGRIHTHYKCGGAGTGRLSSTNPNLQNVPKAMRHIYIPDEGKVFIDADYSQLEVRVLAVIAEEATMLSEIANGLNVHHQMCKIIFGKEWEDATDKEKVWTKNVVFGTAYGRGPTAIARQFGVTIKEAEQWQVACIKKYPGLIRYRDKQTSIFESTSKSYTPFGRSRHIQTATQALNTPIQSSGSDICMKALNTLYAKGFDLCFTVHDSITIQADICDSMDVARDMMLIMESPVPEMNDHSFPVSLGVGTNWRDFTKIAIEIRS